MAQSHETVISPSPAPAEGTAPVSPLREQVRLRMRKMAPLALAAATPLTNAACDPVPTPSCYENPSTCDPCQEGHHPPYTAWVNGTATWGSDGGERIVLLDLVPIAQVRLPGSFTMVGGTLLPSTADQPQQMRIKPDADATLVQLAGALTCASKTLPFVFRVHLVPPPSNPSAQIPYLEINSF